MKEDWWKPAMFFYAKVTSWIIIPVVLAWSFEKFFIKNDNPIIFFLLILISFCFTCYGIYKEIKIYKEKVDK